MTNSDENEELIEFALHISNWHTSKIEHLQSIQSNIKAGTTVVAGGDSVELSEQQAFAMILGIQTAIVELENLPFALSSSETQH